MKKLTVILGLVVVSSLFTGCSWLQEKLQGGVDEINKGIAETAETVSDETNTAVEDLGQALGGEEASAEAEATTSAEVEATESTEVAPAE